MTEILKSFSPNTEGVALKLSKTIPDAKAKIMFKSV